MTNQNFDPLVAPNMGSFAEGAESFRGLAPYGRGGGTSSTQYLVDKTITYIAKHQVTEGALAPSVTITANGQAANHTLFRALFGGDLVSSSHLFGTTKTDLAQTFERLGGNNIAWADPCDTQAFIDSTTPTTTAWFLEAISNPAGRVGDLAALKQAARERNIALILDTTLAAGMPKSKGLAYADILTASFTKQAGGGDNINMGGAVIVSNDFPWETRKAQFTELEHYYKGADIPANPIGGLVSKIGTHEGGVAISPEIALSIADSMPDLQSRVEAMCKNARMVAEMLDGHSKIESVQLAGYKTDTANDERMREYFGENHFVLLVDLKGGTEAAEKFINTRELFHAVALGQKQTAVSCPASSTHRQYSAEKLAQMGIHAGSIRMSVGCEDPQVLERKIKLALGS